jgi:quinol monooxygenase YgiN
MAEVVVVGSFTAEPGREEDGERAMRELVGPTHGETGCLLYALHRGADDPRRFAFIERWASREDLDTHLGSPHLQAALAKVPDLFGDSGDIAIYEPLPAGAPDKGSIAGHAAG